MKKVKFYGIKIPLSLLHRCGNIETPSMMEEKCGLEALRLGTINRQKNKGWWHYNNKECYIYIPTCMRMQRGLLEADGVIGKTQ